MAASPLYHPPHDGLVYLIHFARPIHHAQHYLGWTHDLAQRLRQHRAGVGAALTRAAVERGIEFEVVRVWPGTDRAWERALKRGKRTPRLCPVCGGSHALRRACAPSAVQLALDLDPPPWEDPDYVAPLARPDRYEIAVERRWRATRAALWLESLDITNGNGQERL